MDVLRVTAGQDHGARFGLRGSVATIGRGPVMDVVLTDPRVSRRHAEVRVEGSALLVEDLGSRGGTEVNGVAIHGPTALVPGDRIGLGATEITVAWTPAGRLPEPRPEGPPAAAAAPDVPIGRTVDGQLADHPPPAAPAAAVTGARPEILLPIACIALAGFALLATWMPALGTGAGTDSLWSLEPSGVRVQAILLALVAGGLATAWLGAVAGGRRRARPLLISATALAGGLVAGLPLFLTTIDLPGVSTEAGMPLLLLAGLGVAGCAMAGLARETRDAEPPAADPGALWVLASGAGAGCALAVAAAPLTWIAAGSARLGGIADIGAGRWLVVIGLGAIGGAALAVAQDRAGRRRAVLLVAVATTALTGLAAAFVSGAALALHGYQMEVGLSLALTGTAIALASAAIGAGTLALAAGEGSHTPAERLPGGEA